MEGDPTGGKKADEGTVPFGKAKLPNEPSWEGEQQPTQGQRVRDVVEGLRASPLFGEPLPTSQEAGGSFLTKLSRPPEHSIDVRQAKSMSANDQVLHTQVDPASGMNYLLNSSGTRVSTAYEGFAKVGDMWRGLIADVSYILHPTTGERISGPYTSIQERHGVAVGIRSGSEYFINKHTGEESLPYDRIEWISSRLTKAAFLIGIRGDKKVLLDRKTGEQLPRPDGKMYDKISVKSFPLGSHPLVASTGHHEYALDEHGKEKPHEADPGKDKKKKDKPGGGH